MVAGYDAVHFVFSFFWQGEMQRERERENPKQIPHSVWSLTWGLVSRPWDHDLSRNQESDTQLTEPPGHPCAMHFSLKTLQSVAQPVNGSFLGNPLKVG